MSEHDDDAGWLRTALVEQTPAPPRGTPRAALAREAARRRRRLRVSSGVAVVVLVVGGVTAGVLALSGGVGRDAGPAGSCAPVSPTVRPKSVSVHDGDPSEYTTSAVSSPCAQDPADAVRDTVAGIDSLGLLTDVHLAPPPAGTQSPGVWLYARATPAGLADPRTGWLADVAAGAVAERIADGRFAIDDVVSGIRVTNDPGLSVGVGRGATGQVFGAQLDNASDDEIRQRVTGVLASFGLTVTGLDVARPLGPVVSVTAEVADPDVLKGRWNDLNQAAFGSAYEGYLLQVRDRLGNVLATQTSSLRAAGGGVGFAPTIDSLWAIGHGFPAMLAASPPLPGLAVALRGALRDDAVRPYSGDDPPLLSRPGAAGHLDGQAAVPLGLTDLAVGADWHSVWVVAEQRADGDRQDPTWTTRVEAYDTTTGDLVARGSFPAPR